MKNPFDDWEDQMNDIHSLVYDLGQEKIRQPKHSGKKGKPGKKKPITIRVFVD